MQQNTFVTISVICSDFSSNLNQPFPAMKTFKKILCAAGLFFLLSLLLIIGHLPNDREEPEMQEEDDRRINFPSVRDFLPHLGHAGLLEPEFVVSRRRSGVRLVIGIPTVYRPGKDYMMKTLHSLLASMTKEEQMDCLIVISASENRMLSGKEAEESRKYPRVLASRVQEKYPAEVKSGLIDIISPISEFFPDFDALYKQDNPIPAAQHESKQRFIWLAKQVRQIKILEYICPIWISYTYMPKMD